MGITLNKKEQEIFNLIQDKIGNKYQVYLVGGSVRDKLLNRETKDLDFATNCDGEKVNSLFDDVLYYPKYGTNSLKIYNYHITIATFRKETCYFDYRHPSKVEFVNTIEEDYQRRDFTINCLYLDKNLKIIDPTNKGLSDIDNKIIRLIGDKNNRIKEDPLRIIRAYRFMKKLNFQIEEETLQAIENNKELVRILNPNKIKEEISKVMEFEDYIVKHLGLEFLYNR